jgi:hypothetical protein
MVPSESAFQRMVMSVGFDNHTIFLAISVFRPQSLKKTLHQSQPGGTKSVKTMQNVLYDAQHSSAGMISVSNLTQYTGATPKDGVDIFYSINLGLNGLSKDQASATTTSHEH